MRRYEFVKDPDKNGDGVAVSNAPKRKLDLIPRLVCVVVALLIWLWMVNLNETDVTETIILKINPIGVEALEDADIMVYGMDKTEIKVTVQGTNRDIRRYADGGLTATVDVSGLGDIAEAMQLNMPISVNTPSNTSLKIIESDPLTVNLYADFISEKTVPFDVMVENGVVNHNYEIEKNADTVDIKGPKTVVDMIETARFSVNGSLLSSLDERVFDGETSEFQLTFWDINTHKIEVDNSVISYSTKDIDVTVKVTVTKDIPINVTVNGEPSDTVFNITPVKNVKVTGPVSVMYDVTRYTVNVEVIDVIATFTHQITAANLRDGVTVEEEGIVITVTPGENTGS